MTIKDIARESGYAVSTVSRALNNHPDVSNEAKEKIQSIIEEHKFIPNNNAKRLKQQETTSIAVIVKGTSNMLFAAIVERIQLKIRESGYTAAVHYLDEESDEVKAAQCLCAEWKPLGIIFLGGSHENFSKGFLGITVPCVLVTNYFSDLQFPNLSTVSTDDCSAAECAAEYLINNGHRNIGVIGGSLKSSYTSQERLKGFEECFKKHCLPFNRDMNYQKARFSFSGAYDAANLLLCKSPDITAIFAMSDVMAIGIIRAVLDMGLNVPKDISVIGFDGIELSEYSSPKLSTIRQSKEELADIGVEILLKRLEKELPPVNELIPYSLIEGESVKSGT